MPTSKMSVTFVAGETVVGECAQSAGHEIAARLFTEVCHINSTTFIIYITDYRLAVTPITFVVTL